MAATADDRRADDRRAADRRADDRRAADSSVAIARLHAVLLCDLADSTALIERLGDAAAAELIRRHDRIARDCLQRHGGREIDKTDGFLLLFERPIQAVAFALDYQHALRSLAGQTGEPLRSRVGIHVGEVLLWNNAAEDIADGAKPVEVEGLAKAIAARIMGLARPGQILLSETAFGLAQRARNELGSSAERLRWLNHGRYRLKGMDVPLPVYEIGEAGVSPLQPPPSAAKARRLLPWWRTRWAQAALALIVISISLALLMRPQPAIAFAERDWVLIGSLRNMTNIPQFDGALDTAFRIGLEQSRHVNVLSVLKVRETLRLMQRDPDERIDRALGGQLALREGARALIVPTVAEVGGQVRVTAEVVDPASGVTVYSDSVSASSEADALAAVESVLKRLRSNLGESIASIDQTSRPLWSVTTSNLDALKAYSIAMAHKGASRFADATRMAQQAVELDPHFAMAHSLLGSVAYIDGRFADADASWSVAAGLLERMSVREQLFLKATLQMREHPEQVDGWLDVAAMYPDSHAAYYNFAYFTYQYRHEYQRALDALQPALVDSNPRHANALFLQGTLNLALDRLDAAQAAFEQAERRGISGDRRGHAELFAVQRDFAAARQILHTGSVADEDVDAGADGDRWTRSTELTMAADDGNWPQASVLSARPCPQSLHSRLLCRTRELGLQAYSPGDDLRGAVSRHLDALQLALPQVSATERRSLLFAVAASGWVAASVDADAVAERALAALLQEPEVDRLIALAGMRDVLRAELQLKQGHAARVSDTLLAGLDATTPYAVHAVLARALLQAGRHTEAIEQAEWLINSRGRAYAEEISDYVWQPANVIESTLALEVAATAAERSGDAAAAEAYRAERQRRWPAPAMQPVLDHHAGRLGAALRPAD